MSLDELMLLDDRSACCSQLWTTGWVSSVAELGSDCGYYGLVAIHTAARCGTEGTFVSGETASGEGSRC